MQAVKGAITGGVETVSDGVDTARSGLQSAGEGIGSAAKRAKLPALAGGAALAGLAGTLAVTSGGRKSVRLPGRRPSLIRRILRH